MTPVPGRPVAWVVVVALALLARAAARLRSGLDPASLYLDDQWVAIAVREAGPGQLIELNLPMPIGFTLGADLLSRLTSDLEFALQLGPALCYLASIVLVPVLVYRLSRHTWAAVLGTTIVAIAPLLEAYAVRIKHYTLDLLATVVLLLAMTSLLRSPTPRRLAGFALLGLLAFAFSFTSVFLSSAAVLVAAVRMWSAEETLEVDRSRIALIGCGFLATVAAFHLLYLQDSSRPIMQAFWSDHFLSLDGWTGLWTFLSARLIPFLTGAFPEGARVLVVLVPLGFVWLWRSGNGAYGAALGIFYASVVLASALWIYPIGAGRTDIFSYAVTALLACLGSVFLVDRLRNPVLRGAMHAIVLVVVAATTLTVAPVSYPPNEDRGAVDWVLERMGDEDALILSPYGAQAFSYFAPHAVSITPVDYYGHGFDAVPERPLTFRSFLGRWDLTDDQRVSAERERMVGFVGRGASRLFYLETTGTPRGRMLTLGAIALGGYRLLEGQEFGRGTAAFLFVAPDA